MENTPQESWQHPQHSHKYLVVALVIVIILFGYSVLAGFTNMWPFGEPKESPSPSPTVSASPDPMSDWKTYTNEEYGFSFKYPQNYSIKNMDIAGLNTAEGVIISNLGIVGEQGRIGVTIYDKEFDSNNIMGLYGEIKNPKVVSMGPERGYKYSEGDAGCSADIVKTGINKNQNTLSVSFSVCEGEPPTPEEYNKNLTPINQDDLFQTQILNSFEFNINSVSASYINNVEARYEGDAGNASSEFDDYVEFSYCDNEISVCSHYFLENSKISEFPTLGHLSIGDKFMISGNVEGQGAVAGNHYYKLVSNIKISAVN